MRTMHVAQDTVTACRRDSMRAAVAMICPLQHKGRHKLQGMPRPSCATVLTLNEDATRRKRKLLRGTQPKRQKKGSTVRWYVRDGTRAVASENTRKKMASKKTAICYNQSEHCICPLSVRNKICTARPEVAADKQIHACFATSRVWRRFMRRLWTKTTCLDRMELKQTF